MIQQWFPIETLPWLIQPRLNDTVSVISEVIPFVAGRLLFIAMVMMCPPEPWRGCPSKVLSGTGSSLRNWLNYHVRIKSLGDRDSLKTEFIEHCIIWTSQFITFPCEDDNLYAVWLVSLFNMECNKIPIRQPIRQCQYSKESIIVHKRV